MLESKFYSFPAISLLIWAGGLEETKLRLTQPSLAGTWAELGKTYTELSREDVRDFDKN
jgi:hypothetical protein